MITQRSFCRNAELCCNNKRPTENQKVFGKTLKLLYSFGFVYVYIQCEERLQNRLSLLHILKLYMRTCVESVEYKTETTQSTQCAHFTLSSICKCFCVCFRWCVQVLETNKMHKRFSTNEEYKYSPTIRTYIHYTLYLHTYMLHTAH